MIPRRALIPLAFAFLLAAPIFLGAPRAAFADEPRLPPDQVALSLSAEGWVEAAKARVRIAVDTAKTGAEAGNLRADLKATLAKLLPDAEWHVTDFERSRDQTGLERWHLEAETRVAETALDGLYDRAKAQSLPGEQVGVASIDFTPELAEREAVMAELRAKIYAQAKEELGRLAAVYPDRSFRLREVNFGLQGPIPMAAAPMMKMARAGAAAQEEAPASDAAGFGVAEHVEVTANVVLAAEPPKPKE